MATTQSISAASPTQASGPQLAFETYRPRLGAHVHGVNLGQALDDSTRLHLNRALVHYGVLYFRDQHIGPERFVEVARVFGEPYKQNRYSHGLSESSQIEVLENSPTRQQKADVWHADVTWQRNPPKATILHAQELPTEGGDTVWASTAAAYDLLDPKLAAYLETLVAVNSLEVTKLPEHLSGTYFGRFPEEGGEKRLADARAEHPPIEVPVIAIHPETGRKVINVNEGHTLFIKNVSRVAGQALLTLLFDLIKTPDIQARFTWKPGSLAVWDNRQVQHYGVNDYSDQFRKFHRLTIREHAAS